MIERSLLGAPIVIGESLMLAGGRITSCAPAHAYAIITDQTVGALPYLEQVSGALRGANPVARVLTQRIPPGEASKTRAEWSALSDWLLAEGCGRDTTIVALGGGVVGDLAGFVAATYMRGIPFVQIPTTLLAMVDAALGGKTGVDTPAGKNLIGAFHRPALVVIDPTVLATLPPAHCRAGMAEVLKHGAIADAAYFRQAASQARTLVQSQMAPARWWETADARELIRRSVEIKSGIVESDERESGPREALNFGHTVAHAIETATAFELLHGEAVAIGMLAESLVGEDLGLTAAGTASSIEEALRGAGLPTRLPDGLSPIDVVQDASTDKKARGGQIRCAVPQSLGTLRPRNGSWSVAVSPSALEGALVRLAGDRTAAADPR